MAVTRGLLTALACKGIQTFWVLLDQGLFHSWWCWWCRAKRIFGKQADRGRCYHDFPYTQFGYSSIVTLPSSPLSDPRIRDKLEGCRLFFRTSLCWLPSGRQPVERDVQNFPSDKGLGCFKSGACGGLARFGSWVCEREGQLRLLGWTQ